MRTKWLRFFVIGFALIWLTGCNGNPGKQDTTPPVITLMGGDINITLGDPYVDPGATASDDVDGNITDRIVVYLDVNTSRVGNYTVRYDVSDTAGNAAREVNRTVRVTGKRIFILGSSTVHTANYLSGSDDPHGANRKLEGWGEHLKYYMKDPGKV
jgi:hypothetical protein